MTLFSNDGFSPFTTQPNKLSMCFDNNGSTQRGIQNKARSLTTKP